MNLALRYSRMIISLTLFVIATLSLTCGALVAPGLGNWLRSLQIGTAIAALSLAAIVIWLIITLIFGRIYCSTVCPMGTLQDIASRGMRLTRRRRYRLRYRYARPRNGLRRTMLVVLAAAIVCGSAAALSVLDPYMAFTRVCRDFLQPAGAPLGALLQSMGVPGDTASTAATATVSAAILATFIFVAAVMVAARNGRLLCNTVCPVGAMLGLVSRFSIFQIDIDTDKCTRCRRCENVCKAQCIDLTDHVVDGSRCVDCFDCITVCPNDAIRYTARRKQLSDPMMQRITGLARREGSPAASSSSTTTSSQKTIKK